MFNEDEIYSVSGFVSLCNKSIAQHIPACWLQGEISNLVYAKSGHIYFSLKDDRAQLRCAFFRLSQRKLNFELEDGMAVLVNASPTLYESRGDFQIVIKQIEATGVGNLQLAFEQLKDKLNQEGLFDVQHKKPLPTAPQTIGVVSSSIGAVIQDIIRVLSQRYPFADILLFDSPVQGEGASMQLIRALEAADYSKKCDVIILARGGGSLEDLYAFNNEALARAVFASKTPIISAVGHETDTTICDFVADVRAPTPSAAAAIATPDKLELLAQVNTRLRHIRHAMEQVLNSQQIKLTQLKSRIISPEQQLNFLAQKLDTLSESLHRSITTQTKDQQHKLHLLLGKLSQYSPTSALNSSKTLLEQSKARIAQSAWQNLGKNQQSLQALKQRLQQASMGQIQRQKTQLHHQVSALHHLSPLSTLSRGYSISTNANHQVLSSVKSVNIGQVLISRVTDGKIYSKVESIEND